MNYAGEYPQPIRRTTPTHAAMVSGYITARLSAQGGLFNSTGYLPQQATVLLENVGSTDFTVQMVETDDYVEGPRTDVGSAVALVPRGFNTVNVTPTKQYLEFKCTSGSGELRARLESQVRWDHMAFDKTETVYPASLAKHT